MKNKHILSRKKVVKAFIISSIVAALILIGTGVGMFVIGKNSVKPAPSAYTPEQLLAEANKLRAEKGIAPLKLDKRLNLSAQLKVDDMREYDYYEHENPVSKKQGYEYAHYLTNNECQFAAENLAGTYPGQNPFGPTEWPSSKPHYEAIISDRYETTGFGHLRYNGFDYYVQHFCDLK